MPFNRKNIRLAPQNYLGYGIYFVTVCSHNRIPHFVDTSFGHVTVGHLISISTRHSFLLHAFCLMPDHLHFLCEGNSPKSNLLRLVTAFKQRTALAHKNRGEGPLWQTKFYDHILRSPKQLESVPATSGRTRFGRVSVWMLRRIFCLAHRHSIGKNSAHT